MTYLKKDIVYDGCSNFESLNLNKKNVNDHDVDLILLFTDGLTKLGNEEPKWLKTSSPIYTFSDHVSTNHAFLKKISNITGGEYFNLRQMIQNRKETEEGMEIEKEKEKEKEKEMEKEKEIEIEEEEELKEFEKIIDRIGRFSFSYLYCEIADEENSGVSEIYPSQPSPVILNDEGNVDGGFTLIGKIKKEKTSKIILCYGIGSAVYHRSEYLISESESITTSKSECAILSKYWANEKVKELSLLGDKMKNEILAIGKDYGIVTDNTSLLVLETLQQYLEHDIVPPKKSLPEIYEQFMQRRRHVEEQETKRVQEKLNMVKGWWQKRMEWYNTDYFNRFEKNEQIEKEIKQEQEKVNKSSKLVQKELEKYLEIKKIYDEKVNQLKINLSKDEEVATIVIPSIITQDFQPPTFSLNTNVQIPDLNELPELGKKAWKGIKENKELRERLKYDREQAKNNINYNERRLNGIIQIIEQFKKEPEKRKKSETIGIESLKKEIQSENYFKKCDQSNLSFQFNSSISMEQEQQQQQQQQQRQPQQLEREQSNSLFESNVRSSTTESLFGKKKKATSQKSSNEPKLQIKEWDPNVPYMNEIKKGTNEKERYQIYLDQCKEHGTTPAFYLDVATHFFTQGWKKMAVRIITNILELGLENVQLLRIVAYKLDAEDFVKHAHDLFEKVLVLSPEEPQSYRDLALVLAKLGMHNKSIEYLIKVLTGKWDSRFNEIEITALHELNHLLQKYKREKITYNQDLLSTLPEEFIVNFELDLRIVLGWDTDNVDIDLWVIEPTAEKCYYGNNLSEIGGKLSRDFTQGYGPEEYIIKKAQRGFYVVQAKFFAKHNAKLSGKTSAVLSFFTNYGRENEKKYQVNVRLEGVKNFIDVAYIEIDF